MIGAVLAACAPVPAAPALDLARGCRANPAVVAPCQRLRGRLRAYNGSPTFRLWPIGTRRLKGLVPSDDRRTVPPHLRAHLGFGRDLYGEFLFCPFTPDRPGRMQMGCLEAARHVVACEQGDQGPRTCRVPDRRP